jgi:hypothetical protein
MAFATDLADCGRRHVETERAGNTPSTWQVQPADLFLFGRALAQLRAAPRSPARGAAPAQTDRRAALGTPTP